MKRLVLFVVAFWTSLLLAALVHWQRSAPQRVPAYYEDPDGVPPMDPWLEHQAYDAGLLWLLEAIAQA